MELAPSTGVGSAEMVEQPYTGVGVLTMIGVLMIIGVGGISVWLAHALRMKMLPMESNNMIRVRFI